jgi:uncharacterized protein with von Willebrand factor type A (vWA) domain
MNIRNLTLFTMLLISGVSYAQPSEFKDLVMLYADGKYEKLLVKADKYTQDDKTKKEPLPYIYMSMACFKISQDASLKEKFTQIKDPFKDALKYAAKFVKTDKERAYISEYEDYLNDLLGAAVEEAVNFAADAKYSKSIAAMKKVTEFFPEDPGGWLLKGVFEFQNKVRAEATTSWNKAFELLEKFKFEDMTKAEKRMLKVAIMEYVKLQVENKMMDKAKDMLNKGAVWFSADEEFKEFYDKIIN